MKSISIFVILLLVIGSSAFTQDKPNILMIMGDDIGYWNLSHNNDGMMGYKTPNIDESLLKERALLATTPSSPAPPAGPRLSSARCLSARV